MSDSGYTAMPAFTVRTRRNSCGDIGPEVETPLSLQKEEPGRIDIPDNFKMMLGPGLAFTDHTKGKGSVDNTTSDGRSQSNSSQMKKVAKEGQLWACLGILRLMAVYVGFPFWTVQGKKPFNIAVCEDKYTSKFGMASAVGHDWLMFLTFFLVGYSTFFFLQYKCLQSVLGGFLRSIKAEERVKWRWGDIALGGWSPFCWSSSKCVADTVMELWELDTDKKSRPIVLQFTFPDDVEQAKESVEKAIAYLQSQEIPRQKKAKEAGDRLPRIVGANYPPLQELINWICERARKYCNSDAYDDVQRNCNWAFWQWFGSVFSIPFFARHMAFMWNAEVLGMVWKECGGKPDELDQLWRQVLQDSWWYSWVCHAFFVDPKTARFRNFALSVYLLVLIQFLFAFAATFRPKQKLCGRMLEELPVLTESRSTLAFKTLYDMSGTNEFAVLMHQADLAALDAVTDLAKAWELRRLRSMQWYDQNSKPFKDWEESYQVDYLYSYLSLCQRTIAKFALVGLCQNVATANVQTSFIAILGQLLKSEKGWSLSDFFQQMPFVWINVITCFFGTLLALGDVAALFDLRARFHTSTININAVKGGHAARLLDRIYRILWRRFPVYFAIYIGVTIWTIVKFIAIFCCESHLWNVPLHQKAWETHGCVPPVSFT